MSRRRKKNLYTIDQLAGAIRSLVNAARERGVGEVAIVGGLAAQFYGSDRLTGDIDVVASVAIAPGVPLSFGGAAFKVKDVVGEDPVEVDWIVRVDDYAKLYAEALDLAVDSGEGYRVVTPEYLAVMKLAAGRSKDEEDLIFLLRQVGLVDRQAARRIAKKHLGKYGMDSLASFETEADLRDAKDRAKGWGG